jgi:hypothetical protein
MDNVRVVSILFHHPDQNFKNSYLVPSKSILIDDIVVLVTLLVRLFIVLSPSIICHVFNLVI